MAIFFKTQKDIEGLRVANKIVAQTLDYVGDFLSNGMSLLEVDKKIDDFIRQHGAEPALLGNLPADISSFNASIVTS